MLDDCLTLFFMALDYMQMLLDLMEERQRWVGKRDEAIREISRLSEMVRATMNMVPPEQLARYEPIFERIEQRPPGLSLAIRACFTAAAAGFMTLSPRSNQEKQSGKADADGPSAVAHSGGSGWMTPVEIRDTLKRMGFPFENYKANPLASIHTTLKRMVPGEMEVKILKDGQKIYRLKSAGEWAQAFAEVRQWLRKDFHVIESAGGVVAVKRRGKEERPQRKKPEEKK
jgi:hypothetical protein